MMRAGSSGNFDNDFLAAEFMCLVVRPHANPDDSRRDGQRRRTGEGLFALVRVRQDPFAELIAVEVEHLPTVGIMIPAGIGMGDGNVEAVDTAGHFSQFDGQHVRFAGVRFAPWGARHAGQHDYGG